MNPPMQEEDVRCDTCKNARQVHVKTYSKKCTNSDVPKSSMNYFAVFVTHRVAHACHMKKVPENAHLGYTRCEWGLRVRLHQPPLNTCHIFEN